VHRALGFVSIGRQWRPSPGQSVSWSSREAGFSLQKHHHPVRATGSWCAAAAARDRQRNSSRPCTRTNRSTSRSGAVHRLENPGKILLELIEVQTGSYFRRGRYHPASRTITSAPERNGPVPMGPSGPVRCSGTAAGLCNFFDLKKRVHERRSVFATIVTTC